MALALALSILLLCSTPIGSFRPPPPPRRTAFARGFVVSFAVRDEDDILGLLGDGRLSLSVRGWPVLPQDCSRIGAITCCLRACSLVARADVSAFLPARRDERRRRVCEGGDVSGRCLYHHCVAVSIVEAWRRGRHGGRAAPPSSATLPLLRAPVRRCRGRAVDHPTTSLVRNGHGLQGPRPRHEDGRLGGPDHPVTAASTALWMTAGTSVSRGDLGRGRHLGVPRRERRSTPGPGPSVTGGTGSPVTGHLGWMSWRYGPPSLHLARADRLSRCSETAAFDGRFRGRTPIIDPLRD